MPTQDDQYYTGFEQPRPAGAQPDVPLQLAGTDADPDDDPDDDYSDGGALARRLLIAFLAIAGVWLLFVTVLAHYIPPILPAAMSAVIMVGALLASPDAPKRRSKPTSDLDNARPIGCCQGPRPLGEASRKASGGDGCGCG